MSRRRKRRRHSGPIHARIASLREAKKLSQEDLATKMDVDKTAVSHWETGISRPEISRIPDLANVLGVSVIELVRGEPEWAAIEAALKAAS